MPVHGCQRLVVLLTLLALAACADQREGLIKQGATPAYADGYVDGCDSGKQAGGAALTEPKKDASRYSGDNDYAKGWDEALKKCQTDMSAMAQDARRRNPSRDK